MKKNGRLQRTAEQLRNHFDVERELASRVLNSSREERRALFATLYEETI